MDWLSSSCLRSRCNSSECRMWESTIQRVPITQLEQLTQGGVIYSINTVISSTRVQAEAAART